MNSKWVVIISDKTPASKGLIMEVLDEYGVKVIDAYIPGSKAPTKKESNSD